MNVGRHELICVRRDAHIGYGVYNAHEKKRVIRTIMYVAKLCTLCLPVPPSPIPSTRVIHIVIHIFFLNFYVPSFCPPTINEHGNVILNARAITDNRVVQLSS